MNLPQNPFDVEEWQTSDGRKKFVQKFSDKYLLFMMKRLMTMCTQEEKIPADLPMTWTSHHMHSESQNEDLSLIGRLKAVGYYEIADEAKRRGLMK